MYEGWLGVILVIVFVAFLAYEENAWRDGDGGQDDGE